MRRSFKFLLRPTRHQEIALTACLEDHRQLYNAALEHRRTAYARAGVSVRYGDQSAELKHIRGMTPAGRAAGRSPPSRPPCDGSTRRSARSSAGSRLDAPRASLVSKGAAGSTPSSGRRTATAAGGTPSPDIPPPPTSACRASGTSVSTSTGP
ncbi:helix-turn-helix domain-containing protein [Nonomuraea ferruginea]